MRAGRLDRFITIQRKTVTQSESGEPVEIWNNIDARRPANVSPVRGDEKFSAPEIAALQQTQFTVRYSSLLVDLTPLDRIIYPALDLTASPPEVEEEINTYEILAVFEVGRREGLRILTNRRADAVS